MWPRHEPPSRTNRLNAGRLDGMSDVVCPRSCAETSGRVFVYFSHALTLVLCVRNTVERHVLARAEATRKLSSCFRARPSGKARRSGSEVRPIPCRAACRRRRAPLRPRGAGKQRNRVGFARSANPGLARDFARDIARPLRCLAHGGRTRRVLARGRAVGHGITRTLPMCADAKPCASLRLENRTSVPAW